jgi:hypothetical protein
MPFLFYDNEHRLVDINFRKSAVSLFVAYVLIGLFPWYSILPARFEDLEVYRGYLVNGSFYDDVELNSFTTFFFKEIVFYNYMSFLYKLTDDISATFFLIKLGSFTLFCIALYRLKVDYRVVFLLLTPLIVDFFVGQLRNSLAMSFFLVGYSSKRKLLRTSFFLLAIAMHLGVVLPLVAVYFIKLNKRLLKNRYIQVGSITIFATFLAFSDKIFFYLIGDKRFDIYSTPNGMSLIYFVWALCLTISLYSAWAKEKAFNINIDIAIVGALLVKLCYISNAYFSRYLSIFYPIILLAIGQFSWRKPVVWVMSFYFLYTFFANFV